MSGVNNRNFNTTSSLEGNKISKGVITSPEIDISALKIKYKNNPNMFKIIEHLLESSGFTVGPNYGVVVDSIGDQFDDKAAFIETMAHKLNVSIKGNIISNIKGPLSRHTGVRKCIKIATKGIFILRACALLVPELEEEIYKRIYIVLELTLEIADLPLERGENENEQYLEMITKWRKKINQAFDLTALKPDFPTIDMLEQCIRRTWTVNAVNDVILTAAGVSAPSRNLMAWSKRDYEAICISDRDNYPPSSLHYIGKRLNAWNSTILTKMKFSLQHPFVVALSIGYSSLNFSTQRKFISTIHSQVTKKSKTDVKQMIIDIFKILVLRMMVESNDLIRCWEDRAMPVFIANGFNAVSNCQEPFPNLSDWKRVTSKEQFENVLVKVKEWKTVDIHELLAKVNINEFSWLFNNYYDSSSVKLPADMLKTSVKPSWFND